VRAHLYALAKSSGILQIFFSSRRKHVRREITSTRQICARRVASPSPCHEALL
jgi:hypothetical protein